MNSEKQKPLVSDTLSILLGHFSMVAMILYYWFFPGAGDAKVIMGLITIAVFEMVFVIAGLIMAAIKGVGAWMFFGLVFLPFPLFVSFELGSITILIVYVLLIISRIRFSLSNPNKAEITRLVRSSMFLLAAYVLISMVTGVVIEPLHFEGIELPDFGLDSAFFMKSSYQAEFAKTGLDSLALKVPKIGLFFGLMLYVSAIFWELLEWHLSTRPKNAVRDKRYRA